MNEGTPVILGADQDKTTVVSDMLIGTKLRGELGSARKKILYSVRCTLMMDITSSYHKFDVCMDVTYEISTTKSIYSSIIWCNIDDD